MRNRAENRKKIEKNKFIRKKIVILHAQKKERRDGRVVEGARLESV
jgi:hypothetical protein